MNATISALVRFSMPQITLVHDIVNGLFWAKTERDALQLKSFDCFADLLTYSEYDELLEKVSAAGYFLETVALFTRRQGLAL